MDQDAVIGPSIEAVVSVDDLIMKIGLLTVELMQSAIVVDRTKQAAQAAAARLVEEVSKADAEADELRKQVAMAGVYKESHAAAAAKLNELSVELEEARGRAARAENDLAGAHSRIVELKNQVTMLTALVGDLRSELAAAKPAPPRKRGTNA